MKSFSTSFVTRETELKQWDTTAHGLEYIILK